MLPDGKTILTALWAPALAGMLVIAVTWLVWYYNRTALHFGECRRVEVPPEPDGKVRLRVRPSPLCYPRQHRRYHRRRF